MKVIPMLPDASRVVLEVYSQTYLREEKEKTKFVKSDDLNLNQKYCVSLLSAHSTTVTLSAPMGQVDQGRVI